MTGPKSSLKPNTFNAFNIGSQFSVHNSTLNTSAISEVNNIGSKNIVHGNSITPCHTQEPLNRDLKILDFELVEKEKTHVESSNNTGSSIEVIKNFFKTNYLDDRCLIAQTFPNPR